MIPAAWRTASVLAGALLPLRFFFAATFLYAGFDKLLDPTFFDAANASSLHGQLEGFARFSPLGALIRVALPIATPIGLVIAVAEVGVGVGLLLGIAFRVAAAGGAALSLLFWLTASWATHPYYFGADLPYAFGFLSLALAGHGGLVVVAWRSPPESEVVPSPERRAIVQTGVLAVASVLLGSLALPLRALGVRLGGTGAIGGAGPGSSQGTGGSTPVPVASIPAGSIKVARIADVQQAGSVNFTVPFDARAPLPAGDPAVIVLLSDGSFVAYDAVCTHAGCTVAWDAVDRILLCPCHSAAFDAANNGAVLAPPARIPLTRLPLVVDPASGTIFLAG